MYPTLKDVSKADRRQLATWYRHLPAPGIGVVGTAAYALRKAEETNILDRILERFHALGGFDPELSKVTGW